MKKQQIKEVTRIKKYLHPGNVEAELGGLMNRMELKGFVLGDRTDCKRYGKPYTRFTFDKAPETEA